MSVTFTIPGAKWANMNGSHGNHHAHNALMKTWKQSAYLLCPRNIVDPPVRVTAVVHRTTKAKADAHNVTPTIKACIDGVVQAGVIEDDNDGVITELRIIAGPLSEHVQAGKRTPSITLTIEGANHE